jgi:hypothetical protein
MRVHIAHPDSNRPVCGGGFMAKSFSHWQEDVGPANCARCISTLVTIGLRSIK